MQDPTHDSRSARHCPSCNRSLYHASPRCPDCGWQAWHTKPEFLWLVVALVIGGFFIVGLYYQNTDYTMVTQRTGDRQSH